MEGVRVRKFKPFFVLAAYVFLAFPFLAVASNYGAGNYGAGTYSLTRAASYTLTGPNSGRVNVVSTAFTITPNDTYVGTVTPSDNGAGGTFSPSALTFNSNTSQTFTYTAVAAGTVTITAQTNPTLNDSSSVITYIVQDVPGTPANVTAVPGNNSATVSFTAPSNGGSPITSYTVTASPGSVVVSGPGSPIVVPNLINGTSYTFTVSATNTVGTSTTSASSTPITLAGDVTPTIPSGGGGGGYSGGPVSTPSPATPIVTPPAGTNAPCANGALYSSVTGEKCPDVPIGNSGGVPGSGTNPYDFTENLSYRMTRPQVKLLQQYLNFKGFTVARKGAGSKGNETTYFGTATRSAVIAFQKAKGIKPSVGFFGPLTRAYIRTH
ncbi:MAG: peptidoglycan-binding protein [Patescibacteria group bacterium]